MIEGTMIGSMKLYVAFVFCVYLWEAVSSSLLQGGGNVFSWSQDKIEESEGCNFPPQYWCSSVSIAKRCQVQRQCSQYAWRRSESASKVALVLYYESLCPDCQDFFQTQLKLAYPSLIPIMTLELVPYGNARESQSGSTWLFQCQHGPMECLGNLIETCAISLNKDLNVSFPFIYCMESSDESPDSSAPKCAKAHGIDMTAVQKCVDGPTGNALEHQMALKTDALDPPHEYVPWITLNGVHTDDIQQRAQTDLVRLICDTYQGSAKPPACSEKPVKPIGRCMKNN